MSTADRREFLKRTGQGAIAATALAAAPAVLQARDANERFVVAVIGPGGMGSHHVELLSKNKHVQVAYVCDVDEKRLAAAASMVDKLGGGTPKAVKDLRRVLDDKAVDAVWIATPDHWHGPATILACDAGKHVYVEKPCSHNIREGRLMIEAARATSASCKSARKAAAPPHVKQAMEKLTSGVIGDVLVAKAWNSQLRAVDRPRQAERAALDARLRPVGRARAAGALSIEPAAGHLALVVRLRRRRHGQRRRARHRPCRVGAGRRHASLDGGGPGRQVFLRRRPAVPRHAERGLRIPGRWPGGAQAQLIFEQRIWSPYVQEGLENGNAFYGTKGMLILGKRGVYKIYGPRNKLIEEVTSGGPDLAAHHQNFLDCIASGERPNADIEINHRSTALCHLGNIAVRVGGPLAFNPQAEQITNNSQAASLVRRAYRDGHWAVPQGV